ncbi:MAG: Smr/MutS family protein [Candidatus Riflebacteria bacterium]|nr:Smr/MutS family protein [Candidatus Riflebacteria bacterium]
MEERSLINLEFDKVLNIISGYAGSNAAKDLIRGIRPSVVEGEIEEMLCELDELMLLQGDGKGLNVGGIREIRDLFSTLNPSGDVLSGEELIRVRSNIEISIDIRKSFPEYDSRSGDDRFGRLRRRISEMPDLSTVAERILNSINEQGEVRDDASPALASIRRDLVKSRSDIERKLGEFLGSSSEAFQDRYFTLRNDRYVVPVKASFQNTFQGIVHDQSGSGQTVFIEPLEFLGLNNKLVRLRSAEKEEVLRILRSLTELIRSRLHDLTNVFNTLIHFDVMNSKSRFVREFHCTRPQIASTGTLELNRACHPLLHPNCVPLDLTMNREKACIIITGPNGGGKTVAMKIVGINAILMQSGFWIPAGEDSRLPVFDGIFADIGESQSIEDHLSTFTSHLMRLKELLLGSTRRSLVLVDEIGVGTDPNEGSALAEGVLKAFLSRGSLAIVTSHFDSLKSLAFTTPGFVNAGMEFDYQTYKPTFRFLMGVSGKSNALSVARSFGLPDEVLSVMTACLQGKSGPEKGLIDVLERERMHAERLRRSWEEKVRDLELKERGIAESMKKLENFRKTRRDELIENFESDMKSKVKEIESVIHDLKTRLAAGSGAQEDLENARGALKKAIKSFGSDSSETKEIAENEESRLPKIGEQVIGKNVPKPGILEDADYEKGRGVVECEGLRFILPLSELKVFCPIGKTISKTSVTVAPLVSVSDRLDLRGHRVDESLQEIESYLKLASAQKLGKVFIVHGKGTGALQRAVHDYLKTTKWRQSFRFGRYGEGDLGVTVVVFDPASDAEYTAEGLEKKSTFSGNRKKGSRGN